MTPHNNGPKRAEKDFAEKWEPDDAAVGRVLPYAVNCLFEMPMVDGDDGFQKNV